MCRIDIFCLCRCLLFCLLGVVRVLFAFFVLVFFVGSVFCFCCFSFVLFGFVRLCRRRTGCRGRSYVGENERGGGAGEGRGETKAVVIKRFHFEVFDLCVKLCLFFIQDDCCVIDERWHPPPR